MAVVAGTDPEVEDGGKPPLPTSLSPFHQALKTAYISIKGDFLLPKEYHNIGHEHQWVVLDADYCICQLCGWDHVCFKGKCPVVRMEHTEHVCSISGCVVLKSEMKPEWGAAAAADNDISNDMLMGGHQCSTSSGSYHSMMTNSNHQHNASKKMKFNKDNHDSYCSHTMNHELHQSSSGNSKRGLGKKKRNYHNHNTCNSNSNSNSSMAMSQKNTNNINSNNNTRKKMMRRAFPTSNHHTTMLMRTAADASLLWHHPKKIMKGSMEVHEFVEIVVREILDSQKTVRCREEEIVRYKTRKVACLAKILRETATTITTTHSSNHYQQLQTSASHQQGGGGSFISTFVSAQCSTALVCQRPNMIEIEAKLSWMCRFFVLFLHF